MSSFVEDEWKFATVNAPYQYAISGNGNGYRVEFLVTFVVNGQESLPILINDSGIKKPIASSEYNDITVDLYINAFFNSYYGYNPKVTEMRVYQKPYGGSAFGFLGSSTDVTYDIGSGDWTGIFHDVGANPDFTNGVS